MIQKGSIVRSIAGRDRERFFVVFDIQDDYALIADGELRPLEKKKRKKLKHLRRTSKVIDLQAAATNRQLRQILAEYNRRDQTQGGQSVCRKMM
jgi:ribosomal protein L14E/L6E/L27E